MRRFLSNPTVRGLLIVAAVSAGIVLLSLEESLATAGALLRVGFLIAIAVFLFLLWRDRRSDIETWPAHAQAAFYGAAALAIADLAMLFSLDPNGLEAAAGLVVLAVCVLVLIRVWRGQHHYA